MTRPASPERWWLLGLGLLAAVVVAGVIAFTASYLSRPRAVEISVASPDDAPLVEVYLGGAVDEEGIYTVGRDATLDDVLRRAGVNVPPGTPLRLKVSVLGPGEDPSAPCPDEDESLPAAAEGQGRRINVNTATAEELEALPGIGPARARAIVDHRLQNGPFRTVDDLLKVPGIGPQTLESLRERITVIG